MWFGLGWILRRLATKATATKGATPALRQAPGGPFAGPPQPAEGDSAAAGAREASNRLPAPDLGADLLRHESAFGTPPILGQNAGLIETAQTLTGALDLADALPTRSSLVGEPPVLREVAEVGHFAASLSALSSLPDSGASVEGRAEAPGFAEALPALEGLTDILPPLGSLPDQWPGLIGIAPIAKASPLPPVREMPVTRPVALAEHPRESEAAQASRTPDTRVKEPSGLSGFTPTEPLVIMLTEFVPLNRENIAPTVPGTAMLTANLPTSPDELIHVQRNVTSFSENLSGLGEFIQPRATDEEQVTPQQRATIEVQRGQGQPLASEPRQHFEQAFGESLADVRVHTGGRATEIAQSLQAVAFTSGPDIFFAGSTYAPHSEPGRQLLGHELAHVIQQRHGQVIGDPNTLRRPDDRHEREADEMAAQARERVQRVSRSVQSPAPAPAQRRPADRVPMTAIDLHLEPLAGPGIVEPHLLLIHKRADRLQPQTDEWTPAPEVSTINPPVLRFNLGGLTENLPVPPRERPEFMPTPASLGGLAESLPAVSGLPERVGRLTERLPPEGGLTEGLPTLTGLPGRVGGLTETLPSIGGLAGNLPALGGLERPAMPALAGLVPPEMPLAPSLGEVVGGITSAAHEATGVVTSLAPAPPELPPMPQLPSLERLTDQIWREIQRRLRVERERTRGLA